MSGSQPPPGADGSGLPGFTPLDAPHRQQRMQALARGMDLYLHIEDLAEEWLEQVCGQELSRHEAVLALLAGLRGALDQPPAPPAARR